MHCFGCLCVVALFRVSVYELFRVSVYAGIVSAGGVVYIQFFAKQHAPRTGAKERARKQDTKRKNDSIHNEAMPAYTEGVYIYVTAQHVF